MLEVSDWYSLALWRATCRDLFAKVGLLHRRCYEQYIKPFVSNVTLFDYVLETHAAVISGRTALHFFVPGAAWEPREIDIYVPANRYKAFVRAVTDTDQLNWKRIPTRKRKRARPLLDYDNALAAQDSLDEYQSDENVMCNEIPPPRRPRVPRDDSLLDEPPLSNLLDDSDGDDDTYPDKNQDDHIVRYVQMEHHTNYRPTMIHGTGYRAIRSFRTTTGRRVNVIGSHTNNPLTPLRAFWSTLTMNFLTPRGGACGFPVGTLHRVGALKKEPLTGREQHSRELYERHGFLFGSDNVREALGAWEVLFFGQPRLLAIDFRTDLTVAQCPLPITRRKRGWLPDPAWNKTGAV